MYRRMWVKENYLNFRIPHLNCCEKEYYGSKLFQLFILNTDNIEIFKLGSLIPWTFTYIT